ncbi:phage tail tape measure protein [Brucella sp. 10RB9215]|uniref:phage tail tape measure protein n=2 Tax=unclassified Brucella TaxID=2632610 RepID=UPI00155A4664|nr:phage tail tape measure protein [Brucella sp. 10RB9215]
MGISEAFELGGKRVGVGARLHAAIDKNNAALDRTRGRLVDAAAGFYLLKTALTVPLSNAAEFESLLLDIAQKADLSDSALAALGKRVSGLSKDLGRSQAEIAGVMDNLKVPVKELPKALDIMAQAGKEGAFELKDMAAEFPALTARAQALGMTGTKGVAQLSAALQIARKGAGTSAEAATNTANLMQKIISPETTKKFKKAGIDIRKELKKVQKEGGDVFEFIAEATTRATGGDLSKIGDFFQDAQVQAFLLPLIQNLDDYRAIRDKSAKADKVVDEDFARRQKTMAAQSAKFAASMERLASAVGTALLPALNAILDQIVPVVDMIGQWTAANPNLTTAIVGFSAAVIGLKVAAIGLRFIGLLGRGRALSLLASGLKAVGAGAAGARLAGSALRALAGIKIARGLTDWLSGLGRASNGIAKTAASLERVNTAATRAGTIKAPGLWRVLPGVAFGIEAMQNAPKTPEESAANGERLEKFFKENLGMPMDWLGMKEPLIDTILRKIGTSERAGPEATPEQARAADLADIRARQAEIDRQLAGIEARKHPAMRDAPDPQRDHLQMQRAMLDADARRLEAQAPKGQEAAPTAPVPGDKPANVPIPEPKPTEARAAADETMGAFNAGLDAGLAAAEVKLTGWMQRMVDLMATTLSPTIRPKMDMSGITGAHADIGIE